MAVICTKKPLRSIEEQSAWSFTDDMSKKSLPQERYNGSAGKIGEDKCEKSTQEDVASMPSQVRLSIATKTFGCEKMLAVGSSMCGTAHHYKECCVACSNQSDDIQHPEVPESCKQRSQSAFGSK